MLRIRRVLGAHGRNPLRIRYAKVAEYQRRGVVHLHALLRLDGYDPNRPDAILPPPMFVAPDGTAVPVYTATDLKAAVTDAVAGTVLRTDPHPVNPSGWVLAWGTQCKTITVTTGLPGGELTERHVAGYLAKYATKATETTGVTAARIDAHTIAAYTDPAKHTHRLINACWDLGADPAWLGLRKWAHMLGFGGHFHTKSRRYSTTMTALRAARRPGNRPGITTTGAVDQAATPSALSDLDSEETTLVINHWQHVGNGWKTTADAALAAMAADAARQRRPHTVTRPNPERPPVA